MEPMKLNIQMFAPDVGTISINLYFKDIAESELPESLIFSFDGEQVTIPISGVSMNYVWNYWGSHTFNSITILSEGYLIIPYQVGNGIVDIDIYKNFSFVKKILEDNTINQTTPDFSQVATTDEGMFADFDNEGVTTYFRGAVTNNYVKFANFWWRIIRVNENGSIRLIYDGTTAHANGESSTDRQIGTSAFNTNRNDNAHVGYMYGKAGSTTYEATHANVNNSTIKTMLDDWYESNLSNYSDYIDTEAGFWGDRTPYSGTGTGTSRTYYAAYNRAVKNKQPTFECSNSSDLYTTSGSSQGNKVLQYPIGLITADEVAYAGGVYNTSNSSYYLYINDAYWTLSPSSYSGGASMFFVSSYGSFGYAYVTSGYGVRPVINLRGDLSVTGTGTSTDPYEVSLPVVPITNFNGVELTNIYYNGTEISKMYCNGVLVFEKGPTIYKRRIMVGDNLSAKTIFQDFPDDFYKNDISYGSTRNIVISNDINVYESMDEGGFYEVMCGDSYIYRYDLISGTVMQKQDVNVGSYSNANVTSITENEAYRCLFIEDENIRPLEVGDVIVEDTILYFTVPDDFDDPYSQTDTLIVVDNSPTDKSISYQGIGGTHTGYRIGIGTPFSITSSKENNTIFFTGDIFINKSSIRVGDLRNVAYTIDFTGTVTSVESDNIICQYILVDTTTLG